MTVGETPSFFKQNWYTDELLSGREAEAGIDGDRSKAAICLSFGRYTFAYKVEMQANLTSFQEILKKV